MHLNILFNVTLKSLQAHRASWFSLTRPLNPLALVFGPLSVREDWNQESYYMPGLSHAAVRHFRHWRKNLKNGYRNLQLAKANFSVYWNHAMPNLELKKMLIVTIAISVYFRIWGFPSLKKALIWLVQYPVYTNMAAPVKVFDNEEKDYRFPPNILIIMKVNSTDLSLKMY